MAQPNLALRLFAATALALALAGCNDNDTRAGVGAPAPASLAELAVISDLPPAAPAPVRDYGPARGYPLAERAYGMQQAFYDVPPDYGFAYDDGRSYVWETADDWEMYAEPWDDGYRYYYYEPGAAYPYFVRDRSYGYGFSSAGVLVAVFDAGGRYLPRDYAYRAAPMAGRYWSRGHDLWQARRATPRVRVDERVWVEQAPRLVRTSDPWLRAAREDRDWRAWRDRDNDRELRRFTREQQRREATAHAWRQRLAQQEARDDRRFEREHRREARQDPGRVEAGRDRTPAAQHRDAERRTAFADRAERAHDERPARVEPRQSRQAEHQLQRPQAMPAERQALQQARAQQHEARRPPQQTRREASQPAQQPGRQARHEARQEARPPQARAADQHAGNANAQAGGRPDRGRDRHEPD